MWQYNDVRKHLKNFFVPHAGNNHKPSSLSAKFVGAVLVVVLFLEITFLFLVSPVLPSLVGKISYLAAVLPSVLVYSTNESRAENNLESLETNDLLVAAAQLKANDMAQRGYFSHDTPEGQKPWYFLNLVGYSYDVAGENLAVNFVDSDDVHNAWMRSPTHKSNILKDKYTQIGIATSRGIYKNKEVIFVVQFFGTPKKALAQNNNIQIPATTTNTATNTIVSFASQDSVVKGVEVEQVAPEISKIDYLKTQIMNSPKNFILLLLSTILFFVSVCFILNVFVKFKIQYADVVLHGILLIVVIFALIYFNSRITSVWGQIQGV
jgi:hypothetical protein